jgi:hypothetical protein
VHQLVRALKREQEKAATKARHEAEQLRVQYLAREESFVLDGDRRELDIIKRELESLRSTRAQPQRVSEGCICLAV